MADEKMNRIHITISDAEVKAIDDWGFGHRIRTRAEAVRRLIEFGLEASILAKIGNAQVSDGIDIEWVDAAEALYKLIVKAHDAGGITDADMEEANRIFGTAYADGMLRHEERQKDASGPSAEPKEPETPSSGRKGRYLHPFMKPKD